MSSSYPQPYGDDIMRRAHELALGDLLSTVHTHALGSAMYGDTADAPPALVMSLPTGTFEKKDLTHWAAHYSACVRWEDASTRSMYVPQTLCEACVDSRVALVEAAILYSSPPYTVTPPDLKHIPYCDMSQSAFTQFTTHNMDLSCSGSSEQVDLLTERYKHYAQHMSVVESSRSTLFERDIVRFRVLFMHVEENLHSLSPRRNGSSEISYTYAFMAPDTVTGRAVLIGYSKGTWAGWTRDVIARHHWQRMATRHVADEVIRDFETECMAAGHFMSEDRFRNMFLPF